LANFQNERDQLAQLEVLFQQKKFADGLVQAEALLGHFPASIQLRFLKFRFLRELHKTGEALQLLREMHAMFGDNILVLKELADLNFQQQQYPESLLYYKKLLFLDSFNGLAQERVKQIQEKLQTGVADKLADTQIEYRPAAVPSQADKGLAPSSPAAPEALTLETGQPPLIVIDLESGPPAPEAAAAAEPPAEESPFATESAAELYFKQGLYQEALSIYKNLFEKTGRTDFFLKIKAILLLLRTDKGNQVIEKLQKFLQLIQQRGSQIV
jgi:tetratricopeptide (TPR) repeat protein